MGNYFRNDRNEMIKFVPSNIESVLEVGCSEGLFGKRLKELGVATVWGVEPNKNAALIAAKNLDYVFAGTFEEAQNTLKNQKFDLVVLNDVLEHFSNPEQVLNKVSHLLVDEGHVVCSIPNVRYAKHLYELLILKDWQYREEGILDNTHLRFFTKKSAINLFEKCGFSVIKSEGLRPLKYYKFFIIDLVTFFCHRDLQFLQFAFVAKKRRI